MRRYIHLQRAVLLGLGFLIASLCGLTILGHEQTETHASATQNCVAACHSHNQAVVSEGVGLRQYQEDDQDPTPAPAYWLQFSIPFYLLPIVMYVAIIYRPRAPIFLLQQKLRF